MAVNGEIVCGEVVRKVEVEEKCGGGGSGVDAIGVVANVGGDGSDNVGVTEMVKVGDGGSDCVLVSGGTSGVNVYGSVSKFESTGELDLFKEEGLGEEKEGKLVEPVVFETNVVSVMEGKAVNDDVNVKNGCIVDSPVVLVDVKSVEEVDDAKMDDTGFGLTESTMNTVEGSQVSVFELESAVKPCDVTVAENADKGVMVDDGLESVINLVDKVDCGVTVDGSGKVFEDLEFQVPGDGSESFESPIDEQKGQASVDVSGKLYEALGSQVTADEPESCGSPIKEPECIVAVDGLDSVGSLVDNQECPVLVDEVDELEPAKHIEKVESDAVVAELDGKSEEHQELWVVPSEVNVEVEPNHVSSVMKAGGSSEEVLEVTEFVGMEVKTGEMKDQVNVEDEIQESQKVVIDNVQDELNLEDVTVVSANESILLEVQTNIETVIHKNAYSEYVVNNGSKPEASAENVETTKTMEAEGNSCELLVEKENGSLSDSDELAAVEQKAEIGSHMVTENKSAECMDHGIGIKNVDVSDDDEKETEVKGPEDVPHAVTEIESLEKMVCETRVETVVVSDDEGKEIEVIGAHVEPVHHIVPENRSAEDMGSETGIKNVDFLDEEKESEVNDASVGGQSTLSFSDSIVNPVAMIKFGSFGHLETTPSMQNEEVEGEVNDAIDVWNEEVEVSEYNFLVRIPRFEDENVRSQFKRTQELIEKKTRLLDSIQVRIQEKRDLLKAYKDEYDQARKDEIAAMREVKAKRQEIEAVQAVISRWKNAMAVEDFDSKIYDVESMIQHETVLLIDEEEFCRELKKLKALRDQLASSMGTPEEIRHAIDTKDQNEERVKTLRNELESLKREVSSIGAVLDGIVVRYKETRYQERELRRQFRENDDVRQKAYACMDSLKKLSYDKNEKFRQFKEDLTTAKNFLSQGDKDALQRLCANQVEAFMEQWNNNDEFRREYVSRCNTIASRKQKGLDGAPLVPDDVGPVLPDNVDEKVDRSLVSVPGEVKHVSVVLPVEQDNLDTSKSIEKVSDQKNEELKHKGVAKSDMGNDDVAREAELAVVAELSDNTQTKEEIELARKAEELRKEEIAAKLKEQRRLEEKAKAIEALERKKRNAEKAQLRAELRARKEAEQKEKEREKRLRKKEKKTGEGCANGEQVTGSEGSNGATTKEIETVTNKKKSQKPPAHFFSKQLKPKSAPSPLINKNKKRWQLIKRVALALLTFVGVLFVFLFANLNLLVDYKPSRFSGMF